MMSMKGDYHLAAGSCHLETLKVLEADIQHANLLASSIPRDKDGYSVQMKLVYNNLVPILWYFLQWMDCSCTCLLSSYIGLFHIVVYKVSFGGKLVISSNSMTATVREFYAIILPTLQHLNESMSDLNTDIHKGNEFGTNGQMRIHSKNKKQVDSSVEREDDCGICLESSCMKMVLPGCCHAMCINCYRNWNLKSESCPFCRGSLKRVSSADLWVLTCEGDIIDKRTLLKDDIFRFYVYINSLSKDSPDALFLVYYEYLI